MSSPSIGTFCRGRLQPTLLTGLTMTPAFDQACALTRAAAIQAMAADKGFDWTDPRGALAKVREETNEVAALIAADGAQAAGGAQATGGEQARGGEQAAGGALAAGGELAVHGGQAASTGQARQRLADEIGDLLFAAVNVARLAGIDPAPALGRATAKFGRRFAEVERIARLRGLPMPGTDLGVLDRIWDEVKRREEPQ